MKSLFLILALFLPAALYGQGSAYSSFAVDSTGKPISLGLGLVTVCTVATNPCPSLSKASIFSDQPLTLPLANPIGTDLYGNFNFFAAPGLYYVQVAAGTSSFAYPITLSCGPGGCTFAGAVSAQSYNNRVEADTHSGATDTLKLQGCLADAITNKTACDARNFTNRTFTSEIDVGDSSSDTVQLLLPCTGKWHFTMTDGTSYGVKHFNKAIITGCGTGEGNPFVLNADNGSNLAVVYGTDPAPAGGGSYIKASGFGVSADVGATITTATCNFQKLFDGSQIIGVACNSSATVTSVPVDALFQNICCASQLLVTADATGGAGSTTACKIGAAVTAVNLNLSCDHSSVGKNELLIDDGNTGTTGPVNITGYAEGILAGDTTTPIVDVAHERGGINFIGFFAHPEASATTAYGFQIENVQDMPVHFYGARSGGGSPFDVNAVNDLAAGKTVASQSAGNQATFCDYVEAGGSSPSGGCVTTDVSVSTFTNKSTAAGALVGTVASGTAVMTTAAIGSGACGTTVTVAATGALTTDVIVKSFNAAPAANPAELVISAWPTANNVNFQYCNPTAGSVTPTAATLNWRVSR